MSVRRSLLVAPVLLAAACTAEPSVDLHARSVLDARTAGVVLHDGARLSDAAMDDQLCLIDTLAPMVVGDRDPAEGAERLLDAWNNTTLATSAGAVWALAYDGTDERVLDVDAIDGRLTSEGVTALFSDAGGCGVAFTGAEAAWNVGGSCDEIVDFDVDRASGTAWVADGSALIGVDPSGAVSTFEGVGADLVAWDGADGTLIVADRGSDVVSAIFPDGEVAWSVRVDGTVHDLSAASGEGLIVVSVAQEGGGEIVLLSGATGEQVVSHLTPESPEVAVSADGQSLGLVTETAVYFYDVDPDARPMDTPTTEQVDGLKGLGGGALMSTATLAATIIVD